MEIWVQDRMNIILLFISTSSKLKSLYNNVNLAHSQSWNLPGPNNLLNTWGKKWKLET